MENVSKGTQILRNNYRVIPNQNLNIVAKMKNDFSWLSSRLGMARKSVSLNADQ